MPSDAKRIAELDKLTDLGIPDGNAGQVLTTDGAGNFTFATASGGSGGGGSAGTDLTAFSVTQAAASGNGTLTYNNTNGSFTYTPPSLVTHLSRDDTDATYTDYVFT